MILMRIFVRASRSTFPRLSGEITKKHAMIPDIDVSRLFDWPGPARDAVDKEIMQAASEVGFLTIHGHPNDALSSDVRRRMLSIFDLSDAEKRTLTRQNFVPENSNLYRGWFPLQDGQRTYNG